jgi:acetyl esterase/lipase
MFARQSAGVRSPARCTAVLAAALAACTTLGCAAVRVDPPQAEGPIAPQPCSPQVATDIAYASVPGVDPDLLSLDVYPAPGACGGTPAAVVVWVHGGGWTTGDKANLNEKRQWAADRGWTFVSVNYRLSPSPYSDDPQRVMHPTHVQDVADALQWVSAHIHEFGGNASRLALIGHSAGGHLVSLVAVDERYLAAAGAPPDLIECTVALDTEGYDLTAKLTGGDPSAAMARNAFGDDPAVLREASPSFQIESGERLPDFLVVTRGTDARQAIARSFVSTVEAAGGSAGLLVAPGYSHADVNQRLGEGGESLVTPAADRFLTGCLTAS